ncbi:Vegetative incompatibility protein HET-E-like protein [Hapsidospora chrysogenum ATCC 11550]|uniref:Vegetative incompatibility protein HET-E-like protein n=1 Tax=Hapsidospora chrysogenum (strain ATCC 11550 / CBS 779.69 / DSM 880 / IAM 14645 / JCM 23072 / IMI 49137) TaxID=857340 RepID=A0A086TCA6_HAPC1|nr:Vegetative incompatibility protein HET-E-like protein [Hapsidospora chrysogenum ATCC 11550]
MEAAGLALTVVSLYRACAHIAEKIETYKAFETDSDRLNVQFHAERQRFVAWGRLAGLVDAKNDQKLHQALLDDEVRNVVEDHLRVIEQILHANDKSAGSQGQGEPGNASSTWKRRIRVIRWVLKTKVERTAQLKLFCELVQQLHNLVPVDNLKDDRLNGDCDVKAEDRKELNAWIMGQQFSDGTRENYGNAIERRLDGTCNWILKRKAFTRWCGQEPTSKVSKFLWIHGPAGFGKTVLCAHMIKHLLSLEIGPVVHVFSEYGNFREDPYTAVRSWVSQLVAENNIAYELAKAKSEPDVNQAAPKSVVVELLGEILRAVPHSCLVLDGLDECLQSGPTKAASKFLQSLDCILAKTTTRILITSRDEPEIRSALVTLRYSELTEYKITPEDVHNDIQSYSQSIIDGNRKLSKQSQEFRDSLSQRMVDRCQGQFLWLKLQEEPLRRGLNRQHLQKLIEESPPGISNIYWRYANLCQQLQRG